MNQSSEVVHLPQRSREATFASTPYEQARERLHVSAVPNSLPCRELEFEEIMAHVETAVDEGTGTCVCKPFCAVILHTMTPGTVSNHIGNRYLRRAWHRKDGDSFRSNKTPSV